MPQLANKVIITCAITGSIHTPTMSDALPITPDQIATQSIDAAKAGATILHLHARDPKDGRPSPDPEVFRQFLPRIKQSCDAVINITTGGSVIMTLEDRIAAAETFSPEMCSLNMGSMNFALYPMAKRYKKWKYDWEESYLLNSDQNIFRNTFRDIERIAKLLGEGHGVKFEHECYDTGHLYNLAHCIDRGLFKPPVFLQLIYGILGGIGPDMDNLIFMKRTADRLFGNDYLWSVLAGGRHQFNFCSTASMLGGNVRVGLEDSLYIGPGKLASSNAEQVAKIRRIVEELGYQVATPTEARQMLGLKGADRVKF
jgi:3,5-dioxohexanoate:acetyl-CoA acetone transferase